MTKNKIILILIIILAFVLRFWRLDSYPAFNADEAALGYNAYSLITTGKDEHGNSWPIHFQSFNDFIMSYRFWHYSSFCFKLSDRHLIWLPRLPERRYVM